jgi:hypothetical protein
MLSKSPDADIVSGLAFRILCILARVLCRLFGDCKFGFGPWRSFEAVDFATLEWVDWFNHRRLMRSIGYVPPAETEVHHYAMRDHPAMAAQLEPNGLRQTGGGSR